MRRRAADIAVSEIRARHVRKALKIQAIAELSLAGRKSLVAAGHDLERIAGV